MLFSSCHTVTDSVTGKVTESCSPQITPWTILSIIFGVLALVCFTVYLVGEVLEKRRRRASQAYQQPIPELGEKDHVITSPISSYNSSFGSVSTVRGTEIKDGHSVNSLTRETTLNDQPKESPFADPPHTGLAKPDRVLTRQ